MARHSAARQIAPSRSTASSTTTPRSTTSGASARRPLTLRAVPEPVPGPPRPGGRQTTFDYLPGGGLEPRPFVKWVGGKRQLLDRIARHLPDSFGAYHEPFVGGGAVYFHLCPRRAHLSDVNHRLIRTYRALRDSVGE